MSLPRHSASRVLEVCGRTRVDSLSNSLKQTDLPPLCRTSTRSTPPAWTGFLLPDSGTQVCGLGPEQDLARQSGNRAWTQTTLVIYVWDYWCVVWSDKNMVASEVWEKYFRTRNTALISRQFMCHERRWSLHRPWAERPSRITSQLVREASVVSILRWHNALNTGPWAKNQGFFHITRVRKYLCITLMMQKELSLGENPLVLSHRCNGLMFKRPKGMMFDAAAMSPKSLWNCLTLTAWPSLILPMAMKIDSTRAGDKRARLGWKEEPDIGKFHLPKPNLRMDMWKYCMHPLDLSWQVLGSDLRYDELEC